MASIDAPTLRRRVAQAPGPRFLFDRAGAVRYGDLAGGTSLCDTILGGHTADLAGRSVLLATASQVTAALALIELDGCARRIVVLPPDVESDHLGALIAAAGIDAVVTDAGSVRHPAFDSKTSAVCTPAIVPRQHQLPAPMASEWLLLTSGTTGVPKMVVHDLAGLTAAMAATSPADGAAVWGTFYDIRRYGGLQIFLRAVAGGASLVLSSAGEPVAEHLSRLARHGVTHLSGTPSHWRRALMNPAIKQIAPHYVRLSGEIADQAVLDALRAAFPNAAIGHAYASTEAGVAFDVNDGLTGFPAAYVGAVRNGVEMKIAADGALLIRSPRTARRYVSAAPSLKDADGFVDTGDIVARRGERYYFVGRKGGIINIGGQKVHPEEVEAVINRHPQVRMSVVRPRQSPITGSIVVADVVLSAAGEAAAAEQTAVKNGILELCRAALPRHKVPAVISFVSNLKVAATGKLERRQG